MKTKGTARTTSIDWTAAARRVEDSMRAIDSLEQAGAAGHEEILRARTAALAQAPGQARQDGGADDEIEVLVFMVAGERYAFEAARVAQVCPMLPITAIPGLPDFLVGIAVNEGQVFVAVDLRALLELPVARLADPSAIIILRDEHREFGVLAEAIVGVQRYRRAALEPGLPTLANIEKTYLQGVSADRTAILDTEQLLADPRLVVESA